MSLNESSLKKSANTQRQHSNTKAAIAKSQTEKKLTREPERDDPWFNPYRFPATMRGAVFVCDLRDDLEAQESRKRARRTKDQDWFWRVVTALTADLAYHYLNGSPGSGLVVPRAKHALGKKSRYYPPFFTQTFPKLLDDLKSLNYLQQTTGVFSGTPGKSTRTTIRAGAKLIELIEKHQNS